MAPSLLMSKHVEDLRYSVGCIPAGDITADSDHDSVMIEGAQVMFAQISSLLHSLYTFIYLETRELIWQQACTLPNRSPSNLGATTVRSGTVLSTSGFTLEPGNRILNLKA